MSICGLDFGTSNTTLGTIEGHAPVLATLEIGPRYDFPARSSMKRAAPL